MLLWLILAGPGYLGYGTSLLWAGAPKAGNRAFYDIAVTPGDRAVRRKADQLVTAQLLGFDAPKVRLFAQYRGTSKWEQVDMRRRPARPPTNSCSAAWPTTSSIMSKQARFSRNTTTCVWSIFQRFRRSA